MVVVVEHTLVPAAEALEHTMATVAAVARIEVHRVVARKEELVVDMDSFGKEAALHTGLVVVAAPLALLHSLCKIAGHG